MSKTILALLVVSACRKVERPGDFVDASTRDGGHDASATSSTDTRMSDAGPSDASADASAKDVAVESDAGADPLPARTTEELTLRMRHLAEALASDNIDLGRDALYPRAAFVTLHESKDAARAYDAHALPAFRKDLHRLHRKTKGAAHIKYVSFDVGQVSASAHSKDWKTPVHMAHHAKLVVSIEGKAVSIPVTELIAHKGYWYVLKI
jgi:hypothetical protein